METYYLTSKKWLSVIKYVSYDYQEFLIDNPGYTLKVNNKELSKYKRPKLEMPLVVELGTGGKGVYEVFVKKKAEWYPIISKKLYVHADGGRDEVSGITFSVRKSEAAVQALIDKDAHDYKMSKQSLWRSFKWLLTNVMVWVPFIDTIFFNVIAFVHQKMAIPIYQFVAHRGSHRETVE